MAQIEYNLEGVEGVEIIGGGSLAGNPSCEYVEHTEQAIDNW